MRCKRSKRELRKLLFVAGGGMVAVTAPVGIANVVGGVTVVAFAVGSKSSRSELACVGTSIPTLSD